MLSVDLNGDTMDDLLVGAPLYIGENYDDGRVYVYITDGTSGNPERWVSLRKNVVAFNLSFHTIIT